MPYKNAEDKKKADQRRYQKNAERLKENRRKRYWLEKGRNKEEEGRNKAKVEKIKPGYRKSSSVEPYLDIRSNPENAPEDDLDDDIASAMVVEKKKPPVKGSRAQATDNEVACRELNDVFDG